MATTKPNTKITNDVNNIIDLDLSDLRKKKIRIDGDDNRILEINTSDLGIVTRIEQLGPKIDELSKKATEFAEKDIEKDFSDFANTLADLDKEMREIMDEIFQTNVSEVCVPDGTMFDPVNGSQKWEIILTALMQLYDESVTREMEKKSEDKNIQRVHFHADKYVGKKK